MGEEASSPAWTWVHKEKYKIPLKTRGKNRKNYQVRRKVFLLVFGSKIRLWLSFMTFLPLNTKKKNIFIILRTNFFNFSG